MKLEDQVTNLELSQKLGQLGVKQESLFYWCYEWDDNNIRTGEKSIEFDTWIEHFEAEKNIIASAFNVSELGEMLPEIVGHFGKNLGGITINKYNGGWTTWYCAAKDRQSLFGPTLTFLEDNMADSMAKMLIYLIENKLLKVD